jgi:hypothetical protein
VIPSLSGVFAPWLGERILENSGDLLVVDKPSGLSVHGAGLPEHDVVSRLARVLEARGDSTYLGVHQRLDLGWIRACHAQRLDVAHGGQFALQARERRKCDHHLRDCRRDQPDCEQSQRQPQRSPESLHRFQHAALVGRHNET